MCHSENRYGDKQSKNRWCLQDCGHHLQNKHIDNRENRWGLQNSHIFNLQHNNDENVTSIITHNRVEINLRYIRNP